MFKFHTTGVYNCSYLPGKLACSEVVTPDNQIDTQIYGKLVQAGFRRSGHYTYRPNCLQCQACLSVRVIVNDFTQPNAAPHLETASAPYGQSVTVALQP